MVAKKRNLKLKHAITKDILKERDRETTRLVNEILDTQPVDTSKLRKLAAVRGLVNSEVRARAWPILLGAEGSFNLEEYEAVRIGSHRDSTVVSCDVQRSLWSFTEGWTDEERTVKRVALQSILNGVVCKFPEDVHYYQGLHDIASVLLFTAGEKAGFLMLCTMARCHLRDCTRPSLDAVLELLRLLLPILRQCDEDLYQHIDDMGIPPFFALSWYITWFAHNVHSLPHIARLFDLLLASHPLMPLYVAATAMHEERKPILVCDDPAEMHRLLTNLPILGRLSADELAQKAVSLFRRHPPKTILASCRLKMTSSTAAEARLQDGHWAVPQKPAVKTGVIPRDILQRVGTLAISPERRKNMWRAATLFSVTSLVAFAAMYASRVSQSGGF